MNREQWLTQATDMMRPMFKHHGATIPDNVRVTCGFPSRGAAKGAQQTIGQCFAQTMSADDHIEVIVSMTLDNPIRVLDVLAHELVHAAVGTECGHKGEFRRVALAIGLTGKMTATIAGPELTLELERISGALGAYPHGAIDLTKRKKQTTRMIKVTCSDKESCGMVFRTSAKWLMESDGNMSCPICKSRARPTLG